MKAFDDEEEERRPLSGWAVQLPHRVDLCLILFGFRHLCVAGRPSGSGSESFIHAAVLLVAEEVCFCKRSLHHNLFDLR